MFKITAYYRTGNSFGSEDAEEDLGITLETKEDAILCLQCAKEHYEFSKTLEEYSYRSGPPRKRETLMKKYSPEPWFSEDYPEYGFKFNQTLVRAFYIGYFETLYKLQVQFIDSEADEMVYEPN